MQQVVTLIGFGVGDKRAEGAPLDWTTQAIGQQHTSPLRPLE